jgi:hypothetical protein
VKLNQLICRQGAKQLIMDVLEVNGCAFVRECAEEVNKNRRRVENFSP